MTEQQRTLISQQIGSEVRRLGSVDTIDQLIYDALRQAGIETVTSAEDIKYILQHAMAALKTSAVAG